MSHGKSRFLKNDLIKHLIKVPCFEKHAVFEAHLNSTGVKYCTNMPFFFNRLRGFFVRGVSFIFLTLPHWLCCVCIWRQKRVGVLPALLLLLLLVLRSPLWAQSRQSFKGKKPPPPETTFMRYNRNPTERRSWLDSDASSKSGQITRFTLTLLPEKRPGSDSKSLLHSRAATVPGPHAWSLSSTSPAGRTSGCRSHPSACWNSSRRSRPSTRPTLGRLLCTAG